VQITTIKLLKFTYFFSVRQHVALVLLCPTSNESNRNLYIKSDLSKKL